VVSVYSLVEGQNLNVAHYLDSNHRLATPNKLAICGQSSILNNDRKLGNVCIYERVWYLDYLDGEIGRNVLSA
jgi:hypothetical protein